MTSHEYIKDKSLKLNRSFELVAFVRFSLSVRENFYGDFSKTINFANAFKINVA